MLAMPLAFAGEIKASNPDDPYESFNRPIFNFNEGLDKAVLKPTATLYNKIMPKPLNKGVHNFFNNIQNLPTIANDILQGRFHQAVSDIWRFTANSTVGILGFFDVATPLGVKQSYTDFGVTLAKWGVHKSFYLVTPFFGPGTARDIIGWPIDYYFFSVYPYIQPPVARYGVYALSVVDWRAQLLKYDELVLDMAIDKYAFVRSAYLQRRQQLIAEARGQADTDEFVTSVNATGSTI